MSNDTPLEVKLTSQRATLPPEISRDLLGRVIDEVFDGAIEDATVIEDIYRVIASAQRAAAPTPPVQRQNEPQNIPEIIPQSPAQQPIRLRFPTMLRKMWSGGEVQAWLDEREPFYAAPPAPEPAAGRENYKAALEDIAAVLRQSPEWGADQLNEIVAILNRTGVPVLDGTVC